MEKNELLEDVRCAMEVISTKIEKLKAALDDASEEDRKVINSRINNFVIQFKGLQEKEQEFLNMPNVTEMEKQVLDCIKDTMDIYGDGFSDVMTDDVVSETKLHVNQVKGVLGSLEKKGYVYFMDVNGEYNVFVLTQKGADAAGYELDFYEELMD
jgi:hypothetical protein